MVYYILLFENVLLLLRTFFLDSFLRNYKNPYSAHLLPIVNSQIHDKKKHHQISGNKHSEFLMVHRGYCKKGELQSLPYIFTTQDPDQSWHRILLQNLRYLHRPHSCQVHHTVLLSPYTSYGYSS